MMRLYPKPTLLLASLVLAPALHAQTADLHPSDVPNAYFKYGYTLCPNTPGMTPPVSSRAYGYMGLALYESVVDGMPGWSSLEGDLPELGTLPASLPDSTYHWPTCANYALSRIMDSLFFNANVANLQVIHDIRDTFDVQFAGEPVDVLARSRAYGEAIAEAVLDMARTDGRHRGQTSNFDPNYIPPTGPGLWVPAAGQSALQPYWGSKRPFLEADTAFALFNSVPPPFDTVPGSACYDAAMLVYQTSQNLSTTDTLTARYWADGTVTPPSHMVSMMEQLMRREGMDLAFAARGYAMLGMSTADAFVACWRWKYRYNWNRPRNFIGDHISPGWTSLITTPPFPECSSGHSSGSGAWAAVMNELFGSQLAFVDSTHGALYGGPRTFTDFDSAAAEAAYSRLLGGIHYAYSNNSGLANGTLIAQNIIALFDGLITSVEPVAGTGTPNMRYDATNNALIRTSATSGELRVVSVGTGALVRAFSGTGPFELGRLAPGVYVAEEVGTDATALRFVIAK